MKFFLHKTEKIVTLAKFKNAIIELRLIINKALTLCKGFLSYMLNLKF